jgi:hypothetical protein
LHSIKEGVIATYLPVDMGIIFKAKSDHSKYDNSLLYQDILRYPVEHNYTDGFKFNELARWLIKNNREFSEHYTDSKAHTPMTTRIAHRRHRIQGWILAASQIFRQTLDDLDEETKKLVLFQFKMEIEAYYKTHHLKQII